MHTRRPTRPAPKVNDTVTCFYPEDMPPYQATVLEVVPRKVGPFGHEYIDGWLARVSERPPCPHCKRNYAPTPPLLGMEWFDPIEGQNNTSNQDNTSSAT